MIDDYNHSAFRISHPYGKQETIDTRLAGTNKNLQQKILGNEWVRLAQCNRYGVCYTDAIEFIKKSKVSSDRNVR